MATARSAKRTGILEEKCQDRSADKLKNCSPSSRVLTLEEARCPVCSEILLEPVTMPCSHSVCLHCFKRTVELISLCCPLCRLRVSSWARKQSRQKSLVNTDLWDMVKKSYPDRCKNRMEVRALDPPSEEFILPAQIQRSAESRPEQSKQKAPEEKEDGRRKGVHLKEDCGTQKYHPDSFFGVLSDSENEEPIGKSTRNTSAFVRKTKSSPRDGIQKNVQRSQSCTDSIEGRGKTKVSALLPSLDMVGVSHCYNAGILLSSENSRPSSAPVAFPDSKRRSCWYGWRPFMASSIPLTSSQPKQERSISPESNDSISEELNHFKPIICSPCTPPKRLPDGRVMEPTIVKSTPRNLFRSLQRPTCYEASPAILQKWKQIEVDRQCVKVSSKGTVTTPVNEHITIKPRPLGAGESRLRSSAAKSEEMLGGRAIKGYSANLGNERVSAVNQRRLIFDQPSGETPTGQNQCSKPHVPSLQPASEGLAGELKDFHETVIGPELCGVSSLFHKKTFSPYGRSSDVQYYKLLPKDFHPRKESDSSACMDSRSTSRRGKKRSQKTKHLEETESKHRRSRPHSQEDFEIQYCENDSYFQQTQQEREDRALAMKLQRQFDLENKKDNQQKMRSEKYFLRSWVSHGNRRKHAPRRSRRISQKN
ncbi:E3 ubiquitin-protein ligase RNF169 [Aplochiton taeniatus]